eukprot:CCRYP_018934-RC/>CCRYP_018934-RC protein AED:0.48 eAED:0.48 QI:0/-1/0/1/-1/0/1/0/48
MQEKPYQSDICSRNWDIHNHQRLSKLTFQPHSVLSATSSNPNVPRPWT